MGGVGLALRPTGRGTMAWVTPCTPRSTVSKTDLPPVPDRTTGEPRPPRAPLRAGWKPGERAQASTVKAFEPPPGQGAVLEWFQESRRAVITGTAFLFLIVAGFLTVKAHGLAWMGVWWLWLILLVFLVPSYTSFRGKRLSAGADWLRFNKAWVRTYALTEVKAGREFAAVGLELTDADGRRLHAKLTELQQNRELWDLVYNGLVHSIRDGAATNSLALAALELDV